MTHKFRTPAVLATMAVLRASQVLGGQSNLLVDQQPTRVGGAYSDTQFVTMFGQPIWQQRADNFEVQSPAALSKVIAWGFYGPDNLNPPPSETIRLRFYSARTGDGFPGNIIREETFTSFSRVATGEIVLVFDGPREYQYTFDLASPLALNAATPYWIEIAQIGDPATSFLWEWSDDGDRRHVYLNPLVPDWTQTTSQADQAFQLIAVPEPASIFLLGTTLLAAVTGRRRLTSDGT